MSESKEENHKSFKTYYQSAGNIAIFVKYELDEENKNALLYSYFHPPEFIKMFISLMSDSIQDLTRKNYKTFSQYVLEDEWNHFLKKNDDWKLSNRNTKDGTVLIECNMNNAMIAFCSGLIDE